MLRLYRATGIRRPSSLRPGGRGLKAGMEAIPTAWILSLSIRYNNLFAGKTNTLFSFLEGTNGE